MVAIVIVALALPALLFTLSQHIDGTAHLRDRSLARLVASNRMAEVRLALRASRARFTGSRSGEETLAGRDWFWRLDSEATELPGFSRITVEVRDREEPEIQPLYTLTALLAVAEEEGGDG
jgi:general secretion pathway protein I